MFLREFCDGMRELFLLQVDTLKYCLVTLVIFPMARRSKRRRRNHKKRGSDIIMLLDGAKEHYMMPSFGEHQQWLQPPEQRANEVAPQVACAEYPSLAANNYYGCYYTGTQPQSQWYDRPGYFDVNDQTYSHAVMQTPPGPCTYYHPSYGYGQSYYNYPSPYITGQFVGVGGPMPQYFSYQQYQQPFYPTLSPAANFQIESSGAAAANTPESPQAGGADPDIPDKEGGVK